MVIAAALLLGLQELHRRFDRRPKSESAPVSSTTLDPALRRLLIGGLEAAGAFEAALLERLTGDEFRRMRAIVPDGDRSWVRLVASLRAEGPAAPCPLEGGPRIVEPRGRFASRPGSIRIRGGDADPGALRGRVLRLDPQPVEIATLSLVVDRIDPMPAEPALVAGGRFRLELVSEATGETIDAADFERLSEAEVEEQREVLALVRRHLVDRRLRYVAQALLALNAGQFIEADATLQQTPPGEDLAEERLLDSMRLALSHESGLREVRDLLLERRR